MHGFSRDGKAGFGRIFPLRRRKRDLPIVASAGIGKGEEFPAVAGLEEHDGEEGDHREDEGEDEAFEQGGGEEGRSIAY
jgi:hypothetical protein